MEQDLARENLKAEEERLLDLRDDVRTVEGLDEIDLIDASQEHVGAELHPAEVATEFAQREIDLSLLDKIEAALDDVNRALTRLEQGTYGACEACGEAIADERLEALPAERFCFSCKRINV